MPTLAIIHNPARASALAHATHASQTVVYCKFKTVILRIYVLLKHKNMISNIALLRLTYWITGIADFGVGISVLIPARVGLTEFVYPMGLMSAVAISWGIMLLIADRKPIERRWILMPTIIVVALLNGVRIYATTNEMIEFSLVFLVAGIVILFLLIYSYIITRNIQSQK